MPRTNRFQPRGMACSLPAQKLNNVGGSQQPHRELAPGILELAAPRAAACRTCVWRPTSGNETWPARLSVNRSELLVVLRVRAFLTEIAAFRTLDRRAGDAGRRRP